MKEPALFVKSLRLGTPIICVIYVIYHAYECTENIIEYEIISENLNFNQLVSAALFYAYTGDESDITFMPDVLIGKNSQRSAMNFFLLIHM